MIKAMIWAGRILFIFNFIFLIMNILQSNVTAAICNAIALVFVGIAIVIAEEDLEIRNGRK